MIRNFALSFAAVTLRLYLPPVFIFQLPFESSYAVIAWICWVPNLLVAQWLIAATHDSSMDHASSGMRNLVDAHAKR